MPPFRNLFFILKPEGVLEGREAGHNMTARSDGPARALTPPPSPERARLLSPPYPEAEPRAQSARPGDAHIADTHR